MTGIAFRTPAATPSPGSYGLKNRARSKAPQRRHCQTWLFQTWLLAIFCALLRSFCTYLRSFADLIRLRSFALICTLLCAFACFCVRPRLERPRLGTAEIQINPPPFKNITSAQKNPEELFRGQRWGMEWWWMNRKFQALKLTLQGLKFPVKSLVLLVRRRIPQKFQALKFQNSELEIWQIHPPPFHTPPFACLIIFGVIATILRNRLRKRIF